MHYQFFNLLGIKTDKTLNIFELVYFVYDECILVSSILWVQRLFEIVRSQSQGFFLKIQESLYS